MNTYTITEQIAKNIIELNDSEYIQWADGSQISENELQENFKLEVVGDLRFLPKFNLININEDLSINNISIIATDSILGVHFDDLYRPSIFQYSFDEILLGENSADRNTLADIQELSGTDTARYCATEGLYPHTFYVKNSDLGTSF